MPASPTREDLAAQYAWLVEQRNAQLLDAQEKRKGLRAMIEKCDLYRADPSITLEQFNEALRIEREARYWLAEVDALSDEILDRKIPKVVTGELG